ncbi:hypothetical protein ElyMa_004192900 [Elysia marginata]|uniref:Uncharacterized protein n=1 Tax=Elysia marginata TaxID=1093978 RepID=A0AAV4GMN0_9GAST|nr:hypothetical protein ElyMa_004192900 [Elysia marginata]
MKSWVITFEAANAGAVSREVPPAIPQTLDSTSVPLIVFTVNLYDLSLRPVRSALLSQVSVLASHSPSRSIKTYRTQHNSSPAPVSTADTHLRYLNIL